MFFQILGYLLPILLLQLAIGYGVAHLAPRNFLDKHQIWRRQGRFRITTFGAELILSSGAITLLASPRLSHLEHLAALAVYLIAANELSLGLGSLVAAAHARQRLATCAARAAQPAEDRTSPAINVDWAPHEDLLHTHPELVAEILPLYGLQPSGCLGCLAYPRYQLARRLDELPVPRAQALQFLSDRMLLRGPRTAAILAGNEQLTNQEALWQVIGENRKTWLFVGPNPYGPPQR